MAEKGTIVLAGGAGFLGRALAAHFGRQGRPVVVLSRGARPGAGPGRQVKWDGATVGEWARELEGAAMVVNLVGRSVNCRYTEANRAEILRSRVDATRVVGEAVARCARPPAVWLNASSLALYADVRDHGMDESTSETGDDFSADVCRAWERTLFEAPTPYTRRVALRLSMVFGLGRGSVYEAFAGIVRRGLGGTQGDGGQYVSWLHVGDFCRAVEWLESRGEISGPVNVCAPNPLSNREFMRAFRAACGVRIGLPAARWMLEIGAFFLRTETELLLKSRRGVPGRLLAGGFRFDHPEWPEAVAAIVAQERASRGLQRTDAAP